MNMLEIKNFSKVYPNGKVAVDSLNLEIEAGDIYGFIGHNGAGKTTTIRAVAGVMDFDAGSIAVDGHDVKAEPIKAKQAMAYIPDNPDIYDYLTGIQYLNFVGDMYGVPKTQRQEAISRYGAELELADDLTGLISSYSHGMKQKLAIISALLHSPKLLVLDEPFVGLDPKAAHSVKTIMHEICDRGGAIFFSTHVLDTAEKLCDKVAIIKNGRLVTHGTMEEVRGDSSLEDVFLELTE